MTLRNTEGNGTGMASAYQKEKPCTVEMQGHLGKCITLVARA